ncbi:MAG: HEAT repeat domain-containing protein [Deltaproteobacteria bacterium]|nr:HEAT repeat domain-containing protein [Candidatus Zymogenaceae bacterium]
MEPLIRALKDERHEVRERAAEALGKLGDPRAVEPLIELLEDENLFVRYFSAVALGEIGDARVIRSLKKARKRRENKKNPYVLKGIDEALEALAGT